MKLKLIILLLFIIQANSYSQTKKMSYNQNQIDDKYVATNEILKNLDGRKTAKTDLAIYAETANDSVFFVYVQNNATDSIRISKQDSHLYLIQEAKDKSNQWKPVEYWRYSWCGNSYLSEKLASKGIIKTESEAYKGNFKTEIRFKLLNNSKVYYSNTLEGNIYHEQFILSDSIKNRLEFNKKFIGAETAAKVAFLEPDGLSEYAKKNKKWVKWITKKARQRNKKAGLE